MELRNKTIILGVTGCIAAYKSAEITRALKKLGADVWVVMTKSSKEFISPLTFRTLSGNPCIVDLYDKTAITVPVPHISLSDAADLVLVAPATANLIGKVANGIADDMLSTTIMASKAPVLFAPAMNTKMWENPVVKENIKKLKKLGYGFIDPEFGELACGDIGDGRLACLDSVLKAVLDKSGIKQDLYGKKIIITAGGTREPIDPIRFIGNRSSGKMGYAMASAARDRGAGVVLISANSALEDPEQVKVIKVKTAQQMKEEVLKNYKEADIVIMAAAVADFKPSVEAKDKIKKGAVAGKPGAASIELERTEDILSKLGENKGNKILVGFSVETYDLIKNSKEKMKKKNLDLIIANDASTFESDFSKPVIIGSKNHIVLPRKSKDDIAQGILDEVVNLI